MLYANEWALSATLMQMHDDKLHLVRFCGRVLKDAEMNSPSAEKEALDCSRERHCMCTPDSLQLDGLTNLSRFSVEQCSSRCCCHHDNWKCRVFSAITNFVDLDDSLALVAPPTKGSVRVGNP
ncbi:hypothetical protein PHMEG_00036580 [Phytophthora megakarya]|uniref:Uncharacterized protein n=1 Tax=Phytophthora megakarya TaxID=4795 RepID=A0A225ULK7_9STRA|nr:hypothetical protein PHMEG_00036580 [Phytophthora megakarya]